MTDDRKFLFAHKVTESAFSRALSARVDEYFARTRQSPRANAHMIFKTLFGVVAWIATYVWLLTGDFTPLQVVGVYVVHGFAQLHMGLNIAHDANHGAYARNARVNRLLGCAFDLVGLSSYMWRLMHNDAHHIFVNVRGADTALVSGHLFRFSPHDERRPFHRFQHLYAPALYCLSTLDWVFAKDYRWLITVHRYGNRHVLRHPAGEIVFLFAAKAFYYTYTLVIPLVFLSVPWWAIVTGFVAMHACLGFTLALTFQPNHFTGESDFPEPDEDGHVSNNYIRHIFDTTVDYARGNPLAQWALGGLNLHTAHHMFPHVCHVHYPALTRIIKATAEEHGLRYRENRSIAGAFLAHLRWIRALGQEGT